jgi:hypothetical protein
MGTTAYEVSSWYVAGLAKTLQAQGLFEAVSAAIGPEGKRALEQPLSSRWWDGEVNGQIMATLQSLRGDSAVEKLAYDTMKGALGPILMPLVKVTLALTGSTPSGLLSRSSQFLSTSVRGLEATWTSDGPTSGTYVVRYPSRGTGAYLPLWKGTLVYVFGLTGAEGTVHEAKVDPDGQTFRYTLSWK